MGNRLTRIYTRTGDDGTTGLGDGQRVPKDDLRIEAYGTLDELNSHIGTLIACGCGDDIAACLSEIQQTLFDIGGELCIPGHTVLEGDQAAWLESWLDHWNDALPPLKDFVLPGGNKPAALCHVARTVCRRAERLMVRLARSEQVNPFSLAYANRLSDLLFVVARLLARRDGGEVLWQRDRERPVPR
jgi:cob(I)alamin adenosyltransferase